MQVFLTILTGGSSLRSEWQQVFSSLQDPSKYFSWFYQFCGQEDIAFS